MHSQLLVFALLGVSGISCMSSYLKVPSQSGYFPYNSVYRTGPSYDTQTYYRYDGLPVYNNNYNFINPAWNWMPTPDTLFYRAPEYIYERGRRACQENVITNIMPNVLSNYLAGNVPAYTSNNFPMIYPAQGGVPQLQIVQNANPRAVVDYRV